MEGKIDVTGALWIRRAGGWKVQVCPFTAGRGRACDDTCPLFGDPEVTGRITVMDLCHVVLRFAQFTDERKEEK